MAGQASEPGCPARVRQYLHWTELLPEWRLLNNGHIWSDYAEVAGHGLLLSGHRNSPYQEHGTTRARDFVFLNSQGKWRLGKGSMRSWGESPGLFLAYHISSHRAFTHGHSVPCSQCPTAPAPGPSSGCTVAPVSLKPRTHLILYLTEPWVPG